MVDMRVSSLFTFAALIILVGAADTEWWRSAAIYQIYPRSFKDGDGDGIGDLNGITSKLGYLKQTGVDAIWLSPIFLSSMYDFGYDITDYRKIAPEYGTMEDFHKLVEDAKKIGIRVILDFVPNHTSNESEWFVKSAKREPGYENYYIWADGRPDPERPGKTLPPNNWVSVFSNSAWEYNAVRGQYYLHQFAIAQPDLNYREARVQQEMKDVLRFWLDHGVSGFRVDAVNFMYEVDPQHFGGKYPDEPLSGGPNTDPKDYSYLDHIYSKNLNETYDVIYEWRDLLDEYTERDGEYKIMMTEVYADLHSILRYYGNNKRNGSVPFNFGLIEEITNRSTARDIKMVVDKWMTYMPNGKVANWVNGNHDQSRLASRVGVDRVDAMNMLALLLPGISLTYQGEELGMTDGYITWKETKDPQACNTQDPVNYWKKSRDPSRTPYHWDSSAHAGFSSTAGDTWLPVAANYETVNLAAEQNVLRSHYKFYADVLRVKKGEAARFGDLDIKVFSDSTLAIARILPGSLGVAGVINLSDQQQTMDLSPFRLLPKNLEIAATGADCTQERWYEIHKNNVTLAPHCTLVLQSVSPIPIIDI